MIDLPSLYEFTVDEDFVSFFENKISYYKENNFLRPRGSNCTRNGDQTINILDLNEEDVNEKLTPLRERLEQKCGVKFEYYWVHLIKYDEGGFQKEHRHDHNEDYSVVVYLNDCNDGATFHVLNEKRNVVMETVPERGKAIMFPASVSHGAYRTNSEKKVLVFGLRLI